MMLVIYLLIPAFILIIVLMVLLIKNMSQNGGDRLYKVFEFLPENKLMVCAGVPVTYDISDIDYISFSKFRQRGNYSGIFRIVKLDGKKSRPFTFDYSFYTKKTVWKSTEPQIQQVTELLMRELHARNISCYEK